MDDEESSQSAAMNGMAWHVPAEGTVQSCIGLLGYAYMVQKAR